VSPLRVEPLDAQTAPDDTLLVVDRIDAACAEDLAPGEEWRAPEEALAFMRNPPAGLTRDYWLAWDGDEPVGMAGLYVHGDSPLAWTHVRVLPAHRRRGAGRALLAALRGAAPGRALAQRCAGPAGLAFARAAGAREDQRDVRSVIDLREAALPEPRLPAGYALRTFIGVVPDDVVESYARAYNAVDDAPEPAEQHLPPWTVESQRDVEQVLERRKRQLRATVATAGDGEVIAYSELRVSLPPLRSAVTEATATVREHRGRGLALAVKAESLRLLRADRPDIRLLPTMNAEANVAMLAVNRRLGFVPVATLTTVVLPCL
jgi:GNAT superfamily N-acetyltransferase/RimJ/RimL family protein N-acetyltransferase